MTCSPSTATTYNNLAGVYQAKGDYNRAIEFYERALKTMEEKLGKDHPDSARLINNIAEIYVHKGMYKKASELFLESLSVMEKIFGNKYKETRIIRANLNSISNKIPNKTLQRTNRHWGDNEDGSNC